MKQIPVESFLACVGRPASRAISRTSVLIRSPSGNQRRRQLFLAQLVQEVTLVLVRSAALQQCRSVDFCDPRVMPGGDELCAQIVSGVEEMLELDFAVAQHVRIGRAARRVFGEEVGEHAVPVFAREIAKVDRDAEPAARGDRIPTIVLRAAIAAAIVGPVLHEEAGDRFALIAQAQGRDRRIHTA